MNIYIKNDLSTAALTSLWEPSDYVKVSSHLVLYEKDGRREHSQTAWSSKSCLKCFNINIHLYTYICIYVHTYTYSELKFSYLYGNGNMEKLPSEPEGGSAPVARGI